MSSIGSVLKEARTKKSVSLEDVHSKIKIHPRVLQLLEEDKFEKLPSPLFVKSFLKSYAEFLEINPEELVNSYEKEKQRDPDQVLYIKPADTSVSAGFHPFYVVAGIGAALLLLFALVGEPSKLAAKWFPKTKKISAPQAHKSVSKETKKEIKEEEAPRKEDAALSKDWLNSVAMGNFPKIGRNASLALEIKALDAVWVHVTADNAVVFQGIMKKGASDIWDAKKTIEIWTGNASNMSLTINKTLLGSPGKGVVKKMIISHDGVRIATPAAN